MALKEQIQQDMKAALLGGDRFVGDTLRDFKAAILNEEVNKGLRDSGGLDDSGIEQLLMREVKKRKESIALYEQNGRPELAEKEQQEIDVLNKYLPAQLSEEEITAIVQEKIAELGANGSQMMGQVIGAVKQEAGSSADGATIARIVKDALNS